MRGNRRDSNHIEIRNYFRKLGWSVKDVADLKSFCDLLVSKDGHTWCVEVKDGTLSPSRQKLTKGEQEFMESWQGNYHIVRSKYDVDYLNNDPRFIT